MADCSPFAKERPVIILYFDGDEDDCCRTQCLFLLKDGSISHGAYNHSAFLGMGERSPVSAHYRAKLYDKELSEQHAPLKVVSAAVKANPTLGEEIADYILRARHGILKKTEGSIPLTWKKFSNHFKL